ncbi:MAG: GAF domain-containing protein [Dechloromonas sp.]|uniref:GAF domain-containing protein n=1 Tax=Candidatus Dechloromonas phosphorivorans TaxID=2899244 RepID=A0A935JZQ1_9RHOO|nr:GAF domain-containing protein [Candidatus Dechloromonas phosphorivorans]
MPAPILRHSQALTPRRSGDRGDAFNTMALRRPDICAGPAKAEQQPARFAHHYGERRLAGCLANNLWRAFAGRTPAVTQRATARRATPAIATLKTPGNAAELTAHHQALLLGVREITGFDRVMLYHFHDDFSGEVIAEEAREGLGSYMGLRFPASDIPAIARRIYLVNPWRSIPDIETPISAVLGEGVSNLTNSLLRSVSPVHLKYLEHMGVRASFSLPVKVGGKLWGLVACHHLSPLAPDPEACQVASGTAQAHPIGPFAQFPGTKPDAEYRSAESSDRRCPDCFHLVCIPD